MKSSSVCILHTRGTEVGTELSNVLTTSILVICKLKSANSMQNGTLTHSNTKTLIKYVTGI